jgi:hypothetical protein
MSIAVLFNNSSRVTILIQCLAAHINFSPQLYGNLSVKVHDECGSRSEKERIIINKRHDRMNAVATDGGSMYCKIIRASRPRLDEGARMCGRMCA